jgi:malic enzyme
MPLGACQALGLEPDADLLTTANAYRPTILVGTTGIAGTFSEAVVRAVARGCERPMILPLSNPTLLAEAHPRDILEWTDGRAVVATGSPFGAVSHAAAPRAIGQANNVYVFPGIGLGAIVAEARQVTDGMVLAAARTLADQVTPERLADGALYPPVSSLRPVSREVALAVASEAIRDGVASADPATLEAQVDAAMWWPRYVPYLPA